MLCFHLCLWQKASVYAWARQIPRHTRTYRFCLSLLLCAVVCMSCYVHKGVSDWRYICSSFGAKLQGQIPLWTLLVCGAVSKSLNFLEAQFSLLQNGATHRSWLRLQRLNEIKGVKSLESCLMHSRCHRRGWLLSFPVRMHVSVPDAGSSRLPGACSLPRSVSC